MELEVKAKASEELVQQLRTQISTLEESVGVSRRTVDHHAKELSYLEAKSTEVRYFIVVIFIY